MLNLFKSTLSRLDFSGNFLTLAELLLAVAIYPLMQYTSARWYVEDGVVENLQLIICVVGLCAAWCVQKDKTLFIFFSLLTVLMIIREVNMGRYWLCAAYTTLISCNWSDIPFGETLRWIRNIFTTFVIVYFFWLKVYVTAWKYIKTAPIYVWELLFLILGGVLALLAEHPFDNEILEELAESLFYLSFLNLLLRYGYGKK